MPTFHNSLLTKAINDQCREFENAVGKKDEVQGEKKIKAIFTAKEKKKGKNILQADNRNYLKGRKLGKGNNFIRCYYFKKELNLSKKWQVFLQGKLPSGVAQSSQSSRLQG